MSSSSAANAPTGCHEPGPAGRTPIRFILGSTSPARASVLRAAGVDPIIRGSEVDEDAVLARYRRREGHAASTEVAVELLARAKAEAVAATLIDSRAKAVTDTDAGAVTDSGAPTATREATIVLGCDSMLDFQGEHLGKPHTRENAIARWRAIRGNRATLFTGHHVIASTGKVATGVSAAVVEFADLSDAEIEAYAATEEPLEVAGAFTIDGLGGAFITRIEGDPHGVIGVSLPLLRTLCAQVGIEWIRLWRK